MPDAVWLPVVVDVDRWACTTEPLERDRPVVVHAPSNARFKGTDLVEPTLTRLAEGGLIDYRRISGVPNSELPALFARADIVLDQFALGIYSVVSCEAMAAGRVVVSHVTDRVRDRVHERTGDRPPVIEADPQTLAQVLERICAERDWARRQARAGRSTSCAGCMTGVLGQLLTPFLTAGRRRAACRSRGPRAQARPAVHCGRQPAERRQAAVGAGRPARPPGSPPGRPRRPRPRRR